MADRQRQGVGGVGGSRFLLQRKVLVTIAVTCALSARPLPVTAAFTSLGVEVHVDSASGGGQRDHPAAWAVPIAVLALALANTRSIAMTSGR